MANGELVRRDETSEMRLWLETGYTLLAPLDLPTLFPDSVKLSRKAEETSVGLRTSVCHTLSLLVVVTVGTILIEGRINSHRTRNPVKQPGRHWDVSARKRWSSVQQDFIMSGQGSVII